MATPVVEPSKSIEAYRKVSLDWLPVEIRFILSVFGLYISFVYWGYLQEKITSTEYPKYSESGELDGTMRWDYSLGLNFFMAFSAATGAYVLEIITGIHTSAPFSVFCTMAFSSSIASPLGYFSLKFIPYPLMVLAKSSKQVPVMLMGLLLFQQKYPLYKYISVALVCGGVALYTLAKSSSGSSNSDKHEHGSSLESYLFSHLTGNIRLGFGILLVLSNLILDGFTNNKQDQVFAKYKISSLAMMKSLNIWQAMILLASLLVMWGLNSSSGQSEIESVIHMLTVCPSVRFDIILFCISATIGQVLIFVVMQEFGSLVWITVGVTRKLITILMSIFLFKHKVNSMQWLGIASVFVGLALESYMSYMSKGKKKAYTPVEVEPRSDVISANQETESKVVAENSVVDVDSTTSEKDTAPIEKDPTTTTASIRKRRPGGGEKK